MTCLALLVVFAACCEATARQSDWPGKEQLAALPKGTVVSLKVPHAIFRRGRPGNEHVIAGDPHAGLTFNGLTDWKLRGIPSLLEFKISSVKKFNDYGGSKMVLVRLTGESGSETILIRQTVVDMVAAFREVFAIGKATDPEAQNYLKYQRQIAFNQWFSGPLAGLSDSDRERLLRAAQTIDGFSGVEVFKGKSFVVFDGGRIAIEYDRGVANRNATAARFLNDGGLRALRAVAREFASIEGLAGIKLQAQLGYLPPSNSAVPSILQGGVNVPPEYQRRHEALEMYFPTETTVKFSDADITSQELVRSATVLIDGSRTELTLGTAP